MRLSDPGPSAAYIDRILRAAVTAPDHGRLRPWRFIVIQGEGRVRFGHLMAEALRAENQSAPEEALTKERAKPLRAPVIIAVIAKPDTSHKIPVIEQILAAGAAGAQLMLAANALGYGVAWKSGGAAHSAVVRTGMGFGDDDCIIGFFYIGTDLKGAPPLPRADTSSVVEYWDR